MSERAEGSSEQNPKSNIWDDFAAEFAKGTQSDESKEPVSEGTTEQVVEATTEETPIAEPAVEDSTSDLGLDAVAEKGLEEVPEQYRDLVRKAVDKTEKAFKAQFTKKTQELATLRKQYEGLNLGETKIEDVPKIISQYQTLTEFLKRDDVQIRQGDEIVKAAAVAEPDLENLSPADQAKWYKSQLEKVKAEAIASAKREVEPLKQSAQMAGLKQRFDNWRASRKDVSDDELSLARANALAFEAKVGKLFGPEFFEDLDASMEPFIAQARVEAAKAKKTAAKKVAAPASTELPGSVLKPSSYKGKDLASAWADAKKELGLS